MLHTHRFWMECQKLLVPREPYTIAHSRNLLPLRQRFEIFIFVFLEFHLDISRKEFLISHFLSKQIAVRPQKRHRSANVLKKILPVPGLPIHRVRNMESNFGGCPAVINSRSLYGREENVCEDNDWKISLDNRRGRDSFSLKNKWRRACRYCRRQPFFEFLPEIMRWYQVPSFYGMLLIFLANVELIMQMTNW